MQNNEPDIGKDTVDVYRKSQVKLACAKGLACCGMPAWEAGDLDGLRANAKKNLDILTPYVERGAKVVGLNPTCTMVMRREYPELLEEADRERAQKLADAMMDPSEYLWTIRKEPRFNKDFKSSPVKRSPTMRLATSELKPRVSRGAICSSKSQALSRCLRWNVAGMMVPTR